ncbi:MAG TPA: hypothetical protein ENO05_08235 [Bacteroides sp.]|nr:hypothetical protein [Bacteroides sp.]
MHFVLFYKTADDFINKRAPFREEHLQHVRNAYDNGDLVMAGALAEPADTALLVFEGDSPDAARKFAQNDPYVKQGLVTEWQVRPWSVVIGNK